MLGHNEPLGLPRGSVRAILTLLVVLPLVPLVVLAALGLANLTADGFYGMIVLLVLRDYFGTRQTQNAVEPKEDISTAAVG